MTSMLLRRCLLATLLCCCQPLPAIPAEAPTPAALPAELQKALQRQRIPASDVSILIRDSVTGAQLLALNAEEARSPASTIKVLTTYAALDALGPSYTWQTRVWATGPIVDGRLSGDLILEGGGDPWLTADRWWRVTRDLRNLGLKHIDGDIVIDNSLFAPIGAEPGDFDGRGYRTYNVLPDALMVNLQSVEFQLQPQADRVAVTLDPAPANLRVVNQIHATHAACRSGARAVRFGAAGDDPHQITLSGRLSTRCPAQAVRRVVMTPTDFAYGTFVSFWREQGGDLKGGLRLGRRPADARLLLTADSMTLAEIIHLTNKHSSNLMARTLLLTLGLARAGAPATAANGEAALQQWLAGQRLAMPELRLDNGSGLSRATRISARSLEGLLDVASRGRYAPEFLASLPLGGTDGTLKHRFREAAEDARVRMKTGRLDDVVAIAGYVTAASGRRLTAVVFVNHRGAQNGTGDAVVDTVVRWALDQ
jgi:D-alanyl-D-alanine carboxypeptidase/D-alanyl-D-alanine-endopeptidase (penicillin-binding protein 4)